MSEDPDESNSTTRADSGSSRPVPLVVVNLEETLTEVGGPQPWLEDPNNQQPWGRDLTAKPLVEFPKVRIAVSVMRANVRLMQPESNGSMVFHTLSGRIRLQCEGMEYEVPERCILAMGDSIPHEIVALEDSVVLMTTVPVESGGS
ncbi:MAG: hypothetical protein HY650_14270 [Acidobacteria bacterium]|nr:hypothetical protein [Acidobacteriota bacterium]